MSEWICTLDELAQATGGKALSRPHPSFVKVGTDSRADLKGRLYVALKGEKFDAHDFVAQAVQNGARAVLVHQWRAEWQPLLNTAAFIQVADTLKSLQALGQFWRRKHKFKVLGITGSNGKTSTKNSRSSF